MRHRLQDKKLGRTKSHRAALMRSLACGLIQRQRIRTTVPKARQARRLAEKMVTLAKRQTLAARRLAASRLQSPLAVKMLFDDVALRYTHRAGGYTRIVKLGTRRGDGAELCILEWVEGGDATVPATDAESAPASATDA